jgi:CRISPR-associated protein Csm5
MGKDPYQNAAKVFQMYHPAGSAKPVIPGSSLKGAIRTAYLNTVIADRDITSNSQFQNFADMVNQRGEKAEGPIQKQVLHYSDPKNDPFRCVLLGDCVFPIANTQLVGALKNIVFDKESGSLEALDKLQMQAEVIKGPLLGGSAKAAFTLTIDGDLPKIPFAVDRRSEPQKITPVSLEKILAVCNGFYLDEFEEEYRRFYADVLDSKQVAKITELKKILEETVKKQNSCILRVGRWSQVEFVTYEEALRKPQVPKDRYGKSRNIGTTRTVFDFDGQYVPLGWCALSVEETI